MRAAVLLSLSIGVALAASAGCGRGGDASSQKPLDDYGTIPPFQLADQTGGTLDRGWLEGHVTIVDFVFTRCDTICPLLSLKMSRLDEQLKDLGDRVHLLSFSVDPKFDTPPVLAEYATRYHADAARWRFVTGEYDAVRTIVEGALMTGMDDVGKTASGAPDIRHGGHFLLVDDKATIRGVYDSNDDARMADLAKDARQLAAARR